MKMTTIKLVHPLLDDGTHSPTVHVMHNGYSYMMYRSIANIHEHSHWLIPHLTKELHDLKEVRAIRPDLHSISLKIMDALHRLIICKTAYTLYSTNQIIVTKQ